MPFGDGRMFIVWLGPCRLGGLGAQLLGQLACLVGGHARLRLAVERHEWLVAALAAAVGGDEAHLRRLP